MSIERGVPFIPQQTEPVDTSRDSYFPKSDREQIRGADGRWHRIWAGPLRKDTKRTVRYGFTTSCGLFVTTAEAVTRLADETDCERCG